MAASMVNIYSLAMLLSGNRILLAKRSDKVSFGQGLYDLVGGKVEEGETVLQALKREVQEEIGLVLEPADCDLVHVLHRKGTDTEFLALCFKVDITRMAQPTNKEPEKHDEVQFFPLDALPTNILPAHQQIIDCIKKGIKYSEHGW